MLPDTEVMIEMRKTGLFIKTKTAGLFSKVPAGLKMSVRSGVLK
jgi:hypothetical protein